MKINVNAISTNFKRRGKFQEERENTLCPEFYDFVKLTILKFESYSSVFYISMHYYKLTEFLLIFFFK